MAEERARQLRGYMANLRSVETMKCGYFGMLLICAGMALGCSRSAPDPEPVVYSVSARQLPPDSVYSRVTWSQLAGPPPVAVRDETPLILPVMNVDLPKSTLGEALRLIALKVSFRADYPPELANRPVSVKISGRLDEVVREIGRQANVETDIDREARIIRAADNSTVPRLTTVVQ